jgi:hypothetical protein
MTREPGDLPRVVVLLPAGVRRELRSTARRQTGVVVAGVSIASFIFNGIAACRLLEAKPGESHAQVLCRFLRHPARSRTF